MRAACLLFLLCLVPAARGEPADPVGERRQAILEAWRLRVERNGGVHDWNRRNDGMRVFQEWIALLTLARDRSPAERKRAGLELERYVVDGDIRPLGFPGTSLPVPGYDDGDFDMTLLACMSLLGLFQDDRDLLTDRTLLHLVTRVVRLWGQSSKRYFDVLFVSVPETENHLFMIESTRFLTNQLIWENPRGLAPLAALRDSLSRAGVVLDNRRGDLRSHLLRIMHQAMCKGFFEFNAQIYQRFTIHALDNLHSFSRDRSVADAAACLLDYLSATFAFQSFASLRVGPYRRSSEVYLDSTLVNRDAACSFFAIQSGVFPWSPDPGHGLWARNTAHASLALFSAVLKYRVPDPILHYLRERPAEYRAEIRSAYAGGRGATEIYYGSANHLLTAGGRYETYDGPNFPTARHWFKDAPWVYDVITRSSSLILSPLREKPRHLRDILHFRGDQWRANNLAVRRNFIYGYVPVATANSPEWPHHVPAAWGADTAVSATRDFDFRFVDRSRDGVYLVLGRLRPAETYLRWGHQKFLRGTVEVVDTSRAASLEEVKRRTLAQNRPVKTWALGKRYVYTDFDGNRIHLSARYSGERDGIGRVVEAPPADSSVPPVALPFRFPWVGEAADGGSMAGLGRPLGLGAQRPPHFEVRAYSPWRGTIALSDGQGNMYVYNPATGGYCLANFREWWNPRRKILPSAGDAPGIPPDPGQAPAAAWMAVPDGIRPP